MDTLRNKSQQSESDQKVSPSEAYSASEVFLDIEEELKGEPTDAFATSQWIRVLTVWEKEKLIELKKEDKKTPIPVIRVDDELLRYDISGHTLLLWAIKCRQLKWVHLLAQKRQLLDAAHLKDSSLHPINLAINIGYIPMVKILLEAGANISHLEDYDRESEIGELLRHHQLDRYIQRRTELEADYSGSTWGFTRTQKLEAAKVFRNEVTRGNVTVAKLQLLGSTYPAVRQGKLGNNFMKFMKSADSIAYQQKENIYLPLLNQLRIPSCSPTERERLYRQILKLREKEGVAENHFDRMGFTLLHWAVLCNNVEAVKRLRNLTVTESIMSGKTADGEEIKQVPLCNVPSEYYGYSGYDDNDRNKTYHFTPLWLAAEGGHADIVRVLLESKETKEAKDFKESKEEKSKIDFMATPNNDARTPLAVACQNISRSRDKYLPIAKMLLIPTLESYIENRNNEADYRGCRLFHYECFQYSKRQKLAAARALLELLRNKDHTYLQLIELDNKYPALMNGKLRDIYQVANGLFTLDMPVPSQEDEQEKQGVDISAERMELGM